MKRYITGLMAMLVCTFLSCQREIEDGYGYLSLQVGRDLSEEIIVKASEPVTEPYIIEIHNSAGLVEKIEDHTLLSESSPLELLIGTYTVKAMNREFANASFEEYFAAEKTVKIHPDKTTVYNLVCTRADVRFSVEFPADFADFFKKYEVHVGNGVGQELVLSSSPDQEDPMQASLSDVASFDVTGELSWSLYLKNMDSADDNETGGVYVSDIMTYDNVKAGDHYHVSFALADPEVIDGVFALRITVNGEMIEELHEIKIDFDQKGKPSYTANEGFDIPSEDGEYMTVIFESATDKYLTFSTPAGLKHLYVSHYDEDLTKIGLPQRTDLYQGTQAEKDQLTLLGIAHNVGEFSSVVNLTNFIKTLPQGVYDFSVTAIDTKGRYAKCRIPMEIVLDVDAEAVNAVPWGCFAFVEARYFADPAPEGLTFQYRHVLDEEWTTLSTATIEVNSQTMRYTGRIDGLEAGSEYVFRAMSQKDINDGKESKEQRFVTEGAPTILNMGFDAWFPNGNVWYPNVNLDGSNYVWDTANGGTSSVSIYPTEPENEHLATVEESNVKAAKLMSKEAPLVGLAAGNIYTGDFVKAEISLSNPGAQLDWGTPFTGRPIALRGYVHYIPGNVDKAASSHSYMKDNPDIGQVQILLTDWATQFRINTQTKTFVQFDTDEGIIAYSTLDFNATDGYIQFTLPIEYRSMTRIPRYVVIVGSASKFGDYFTGSTSSVMYLDEFEFVYDPADLSEEEFEKVFANVK